MTTIESPGSLETSVTDDLTPQPEPDPRIATDGEDRIGLRGYSGSSFKTQPASADEDEMSGPKEPVTYIVTKESPYENLLYRVQVGATIAGLLIAALILL